MQRVETTVWPTLKLGQAQIDQSLTYFEIATRIAKKDDLTPDGSFVKTDITSIYIEKAEALTLFGRFADAHHTLDIAHNHLSPEQTRWKVNLLLAEAGTYLAERDVAGCCYSSLDALTIARAVNLAGKELRVQTLADECRRIDASHATLTELDKQLLSV